MSLKLSEAFISDLDAVHDASGACDTPEMPVSLAFLQHLSAVYPEAARQLPNVYDPPEEDLLALSSLFFRWRKAEIARRSLTDSFLQELTFAYRDALREGTAYQEPGEPHLAALALTLQGWRNRTLARLAEQARDIPPDDPLLCPISLYGCMERGRLEIAHTRTLRWLLDPQEGHGFGLTLLEALLRHLADRGSKSPVKVSTANVRSERRVSELSGVDLGRVDIVAEGNGETEGRSCKWILLIEAKIDASEGTRQLERYEKWLKEHAYDHLVFRMLLSAEPRAPESGQDDWTNLTFLDLACLFRGRFGDLAARPGYHFLRFYLCGILRDVCRWSLPLRDLEDCNDPYGFVQYLDIVHRPSTGEPTHGIAG